MDTRVTELTDCAFELLPLAAMITDADGMIVARNLAADRTLLAGADLQAVLGQPGNGSVDWMQQIGQLTSPAGETMLDEVSLPGRDDRRIIAEVHLRRVEATGGVLVTINDISRRITMQRWDAVNQKVSIVGQFAARLAHELNNPLDGTLRYLGLARRTADHQTLKHIKGADAGLKRLAEIVCNLAHHGHLGQASVESQTVCSQLNQALAVTRPRSQSQAVEISTFIEPIASWSAPAGMFQVFCNVIMNALDAMADGGRLEIRLRPRDNDCIIEFTDTGAGLPEENCDRIFDPLFTTKTSDQNMGLGLAISKEILSRASGTIKASSPEGGGTLITIAIPVEHQI